MGGRAASVVAASGADELEELEAVVGLLDVEADVPT